MGKNGISPGQIPHLVRLTADLFREMNKEIKSPNDNPANKLEENKEMHFVADLLKDLVDTAYPKEEREPLMKCIKVNGPTLGEDEDLRRLINMINQGGEF